MTEPSSALCGVAIQDRSRLFRESLAVLLPNVAPLAVTALAADADELRSACLRKPPDAVLLEMGDVPWDISTVIDEVSLARPSVVIVGLSPGSRVHSRDGVRLLPRSSPSQAFANALLGNEPSEDSQRAKKAESGSTELESLTRREMQVLALIGGGSTTAQAAQRLGISTKTVENHKVSLFAKLGVQNQSHAVGVAMRSGLIGKVQRQVGNE